MRMPSATVTRQPCWFGTPSISIRQSKHTPIRQYGARGAPVTGVVRAIPLPQESTAAAALKVSGTRASTPSMTT